MFHLGTLRLHGLNIKLNFKVKLCAILPTAVSVLVTNAVVYFPNATEEGLGLKRLTLAINTGE